METNITLTLSPAHAQIILNLLGEAPFKIAQPIITAIQTQAAAQLAEQQKRDETKANDEKKEKVKA